MLDVLDTSHGEFKTVEVSMSLGASVHGGKRWALLAKLARFCKSFFEDAFDFSTQEGRGAAQRVSDEDACARGRRFFSSPGSKTKGPLSLRKPSDLTASIRGRTALLVRISVSILILAVVVGVVGRQAGTHEIVGYLRGLSPGVVALIVVGLFVNAGMAVLRLKVLAADAGYPVRVRQAMAAVGGGSLGGAAFFQIAGQLMARGVVMRRSGVPFGAVVAITLYERIVAAGTSALIALLGALYIFGGVYLDQGAGGAQLVKLFCGFCAAVGMAGWLGFGALAKREVWPLLTRRFLFRLLRVAVLTLLVQLPMMGVYVCIMHAFSPHVPIISLVAASAVVMFAASIPVSFAGWGVRELSAVFALGAVGASGSSALTAAIIIGVGSLLAMGVLLASSVGFADEAAPKAVRKTGAEVVDYFRALGWIVPLMAAVFVLFQIYIPLGSGFLNVNLADPVAILGGSLFVLQAISHWQWPVWRVKYVNLFVLLATFALGYSLLLGAYRFGWTDWALVNRFAGWFVLLAYVATGALIVSVGGERAFRVFALTYVGAAVGVVLLELGLVYANRIGFDTRGLIIPNEIAGFAQNRNALAFQLLMALSAGFVLLEGSQRRVFVFAILFAAFWFAGSRSGWISLFCVSVLAWHFKRVSFRELAAAFVGAGVLVGVTIVIVLILPMIYSGHALGGIFPEILPGHSSTAERLLSLNLGWNLFISHPIFGSGLGAFVNLKILTDAGAPLVIHSTELWLLAEFGVVGLLIFMVPALYIWFAEWRRAKVDIVSAVVALNLLGFAVMSGPADMFYQRTFWLMFGAALAVSGSVLKSRTANVLEPLTGRT